MVIFNYGMYSWNNLMHAVKVSKDKSSNAFYCTSWDRKFLASSVRHHAHSATGQLPHCNRGYRDCSVFLSLAVFGPAEPSLWSAKVYVHQMGLRLGLCRAGLCGCEFCISCRNFLFSLCASPQQSFWSSLVCPFFSPRGGPEGLFVHGSFSVAFCFDLTHSVLSKGPMSDNTGTDTVLNSLYSS